MTANELDEKAAAWILRVERMANGDFEGLTKFEYITAIMAQMLVVAEEQDAEQKATISRLKAERN